MLKKIKKIAKETDDKLVLKLLVAFSFIVFMAIALDARYQLNNDAISYLSIAEHYANGRFDLAINAWLPPVISWLVAPFVYFGVDPRLAFFIVNAFAATAILIIGMKVVRRSSKGKFIPTFFFWAAVSPFLAYMVGRTITPDLLVVLWVMLFLVVLYKADDLLNKKESTTKVGIVLGVLGTFGLLVKPILLYYFIAVVVSWLAVRVIVYVKPFKKLFKKETLKQQIILPAIIFGSLFISLSPWVLALSAKYDTFTVNSSFSYYTSSLDGVDEVEDTDFLDIPPHEEATTYLEDRTVVIQENNSAPSITGIDYYVSERITILPIYIGDLVLMSPWILIVMISVGVALLFNKINYKKASKTMIASILIVIHFLGYWAAKVRVSEDAVRGEERYNWPLLVLILLIVAINLPRLIKLIREENLIRNIIFAALVALVPISVFVRFFPSYERLVAPARQQSLEILSEEINQTGFIEPGSKIAGNNTRPLLKLAYFWDAQTYGSIGERDFESAAVQQALSENNIDYFLRFVPLSDAEKPYDRLKSQMLIKEVVSDRVTCRDARAVGVEECLIQVYKLDF